MALTTATRAGSQTARFGEGALRLGVDPEEEVSRSTGLIATPLSSSGIQSLSRVLVAMVTAAVSQGFGAMGDVTHRNSTMSTALPES